jgi:hypothetical protein
MLAAALFAVVDLSTAEKLPQDVRSIAEAIVSVSADYVVPATSSHRSNACRGRLMACLGAAVGGV